MRNPFKFFVVAFAALVFLAGLTAVMAQSSNPAATSAPQTSSYTSGGFCNPGCGSSIQCTGKLIGSPCGTDGVCTSSCQCVPSVVNCDAIDLDTSKKCCESKGFKWAKGGETGQFGQYTLADINAGRAECVGDDSGEYYRFRECEGGACSTDVVDAAACASPNSCVYQGKCFSRLDKITEEQSAVKNLIEANKDREDEKARLLKELVDKTNKAKTAKSNRERRHFSKEIAAVMKKIAEQKDESNKELGEVIGTQGQGVVVTNAQSGAVATCIAR